MIKRLIFLTALLLAATWVFSGSVIDETWTVRFGSTDTTGDTAMVIAFTVSQGLDSHKYLDTFVTGAGAADSTLVTWTAPVQTMIWTLGDIDATPLIVDSAAIGVVGCTITLAGGDKGIEYDLSTGADDSLGTALDSIVAIWTAATNLSDSVAAHDSGTYLKFVSQFSEDVFTARWTVKMTTDSTDTAGTITTVSMVCDSMNAALNTAIGTALTSIKHPSADSFLVASDDPGLAFTVYFGDTISDNGDTVHGQLNVTSYSSLTDTIGDNESFIGLIGPRDNDFNRYPEIIRLILKPSTTTDAGLGLSDSGYLWLYSVFNDEYHLLGVDTQAALPCTLRLPYAGPPADSLFKEKLVLVWRVADTVSDTVITGITYSLDVNYILGVK